MAKDVIITPLDGDIQFKNASSVDAGRIEQAGDDLAITNAVGDVLIGDGASDLYIGDGVNSVDIVFDVNGSVRGETGVTLTLGASGSTTAIAGLSSSSETSAVMRNTTTGALSYRTLGSNAFNSNTYDNYNYWSISDDGASTTTQIGSGNNLNIVGGTGITAVLTSANTLTITNTANGDITGVTAGTGLSGGGTSGTVTLSHADTSSVTSVDNSGGTVIQDITVDTYGHVTAIGSYNLDGRYYTEAESDSRFLNSSGDTMTGTLTINSGIPVFFKRSGGFAYQRADARLDGSDQARLHWYGKDDNDLTRNFKHAWYDGSNYINVTASSGGRIDFTGTAASMYIGTDKVFDDGYHPNADKLTSPFTLNLTGAVTGSASIDGSATVSMATTATSDPTLTLAGDATGSATFTNLGNATLTVTVVDDSHNHIISNVDGLQTALDGKDNYSYWSISDDGTATTTNITSGANLNIIGGGGINSTLTSSNTLTISHTDTSSAGSVNNSNGTVIQDITLDTYGHVTAIGSYNLDGRYFTETESDARYLRGDTSDTTVGNITMSKADPILTLNDTSASDATSLYSFIPFQSQGTQRGYVGYGSTSTDYLYLRNTSGRVQLDGSAGVYVQNGLYFGSGTDALDQYEEGSWTPVYASSTATVTSVTYTSVRAGRYIRVGNVVHLWGRIETDVLTWSSTSGAVYVDGLPFTVTDVLSGPSFYAGCIGYATAFAGEEPKMLGIHGTERIYLYYHSSTTSNIINIAPTDMDSGAGENDLMFQITYRTD